MLARLSIALWFSALLATMNLAVGCGGPQWPTTSAQVDQRFYRQQLPVGSVDILPPDVQVWTQPDSGISAAKLATDLDGVIRGVAATSLAQRGYAVRSQIDWNGDFIAGDGLAHQAYAPRSVEETSYALSSYGRAVEQADRGLLVPYLPHRLGQATGADATLYIGGWAYVGEDPNNTTGKKVAKGVVIGLFVAVVVVVAILVLRKGGGGLGKAAGSAGRAAAGAGRAAARVAVTAGRTVGRVVSPVLRGAARLTPRIARGTLRTLDAFGRADTHIYIYGGRPEYYEEKRTPKRGRSKMLLEMTLVDNHTGVVLWHARDLFPAHATRLGDVRKAFQRMVATLPAQ